MRLIQLDLSPCLLYFHFHLANTEVVYASCCLWILVLGSICWSRLLKHFFLDDLLLMAQDFLAY